jgi:hypothetical protein
MTLTTVLVAMSAYELGQLTGRVFLVLLVCVLLRKLLSR